MYSKVLVVFAVAALASANDLLQVANHTEGLERVFHDHLVAEWGITKQTKEVFVNASEPIAKINVTDLREGKDGEAIIISGGIGHENVTISLKSPAAFRGFDFLVEIFMEDASEIQRGHRGSEPQPEDVPQEPKINIQLPEIQEPLVPAVPGFPTDQPEATGHPTITGKPEVTGHPTSTGKPEVSGHPTSTRKPEVSVHPTTAGKPEVSGHPTSTGKPEVTGFPTQKVTAPKFEVEVPQEVEQHPQMHASH